jgi:hypothetical protein
LAAQHPKALVRSENWRAIIQDLVLAGRPDDANALAGNPSDPWHKSFLEEYMAVVEVATNARTNPSHDASLAPILRLIDFSISNDRTLSRYDRISSSYHLLALELLGEQPFSRGGASWLVDAEKAHLAAIRLRPTPPFKWC